MKKSIIIALLLASSVSLKAQGIAGTIVARSVYTQKTVCFVQSGKIHKSLTAADVKYILSKRNSLQSALNLKSISNNETADVILAILQARK